MFEVVNNFVCPYCDKVVIIDGDPDIDNLSFGWTCSMDGLKQWFHKGCIYEHEIMKNKTQIKLKTIGE